MNYWRLPLTFDQAEEIRKHDSVASVLEQCDNDAYPCYDPTTSLKWQEDVLPQLSYISWPDTEPRTPFSKVRDRYYFDDSDGKDIDVWIMDSGLTIEHPEFDHWSRDRVDWLIKVPDYDGVAREDDSQTDVDLKTKGKSHGTSMTSVIAGKTLGVAKSIKPHLARLPRRNNIGYWTQEDFIDTIAAIDERLANDGGANGVLLLAHYYIRPAFYRLKGDGTADPLLINGEPIDQSFGFEWRLHTIIQSIVEKGMLVITGSGNEPGKSTIDGWPQNYAKRDDSLRIPELLVVGAVQPDEPGDGVLGYGSTDLAQGLPHVYAPGHLVQAAEGNSNQWGGGGYYKRTSGSSIGKFHAHC
ncbi:peptidase S8/S53 domain-containing protein [Thelonectria olida]|uniref:Peptidase S8/S53 domain-containing protein n=1 Tax=Thelonectria olida TaxID=1576542 RepID=A0A9P9ARJ2_9HYPO|nr:peptidase S8/S53 domain-containing protein [Thelonectria olida]